MAGDTNMSEPVIRLEDAEALYRGRVDVLSGADAERRLLTELDTLRTSLRLAYERIFKLKKENERLFNMLTKRRKPTAQPGERSAPR